MATEGDGDGGDALPGEGRPPGPCAAVGGRRRRLILVPAALGSPGSGSRYSMLAPDVGEVPGGMEGAEEVAIGAAMDVLAEDGCGWTTVSRRPGKSRDELVQDF